MFQSGSSEHHSHHNLADRRVRISVQIRPGPMTFASLEVRAGCKVLSVIRIKAFWTITDLPEVRDRRL